MSEQKVTVSKKGMGFIGLLTITFIALKLFKIIAWSWWLVVSPILISSTVILLGIIVAIILAIKN